MYYPRTLISAADRSFYFTAPKLWNILPPALRSSGSVTVFKGCRMGSSDKVSLWYMALSY